MDSSSATDRSCSLGVRSHLLARDTVISGPLLCQFDGIGDFHAVYVDVWPHLITIRW